MSHNIIIEKNKAKTLSNDCIMCGHCVAVCPQNAVTISGYTSKPLPKKDISLNAEDILATMQFRRTIRQ
ncbi:MAG: 4Fe-4S binding protein, partial [Oscillospiraceae bacterium]